MVRVTECRELAENLYLKEIYGLSSDTKPTANIANGSTFVEMDTSDVYFFDEEHSVWLKAGDS